MLTQGEDVEAHALRERGWSISAIARHLGRDRKTVHAYLNGARERGRRASATADPLALFEAYVRARFADDCHLWASALFDEVVALGYDRSYPTFVRQVRQRGLRPHCEACRGVKGRDTIEIEHPAGEEIQWDWFERRNAPWGGTAYVLLGTLPHSSRTRGVLAERLDQAHLVEAMDAVMRRLGGTARVWRTDRLATVIVPGTRDVQPSFAPVAKHYRAIVEPCPPRRGLGRPVEFGYKAQIVDNEDGVIVDHNVECGNPPDAPMLAPAIERIARRAGRVPRAVTADRGYGEQGVEDVLHAIGVRHVVLPRKGKPNAQRRQVQNRRAFREMVKWRTGCEGRISCAKRDFGLERTRIDGLHGARTWCGHGIFAHNLVKIAGLLQ